MIKFPFSEELGEIVLHQKTDATRESKESSAAPRSQGRQRQAEGVFMERTLNQPHARHERKLKNPIIGLLDFVISYLERRKQRADLQCMSEHMLKDIGLSRADVMREASKPFWRP